MSSSRARGVAVAESLDGQLGEPGEDVVATARARRAHDRDPLGEQAAGDETENLRGGVVEPLRVVDDADERLLLGDLGEQRQRGQPDEEAVRRGALRSVRTPSRAHRAAGRAGVESIQHRRAELMEPAVRQLHLRLDADGPRDVPAVDAVGQVVQQRALAHARLAPQDDDSTPPGERVGQELVERFALAPTSEQLRRLTAIVARGRPPSPFNDPSGRDLGRRLHL